jgi:hypothetical protein
MTCAAEWFRENPGPIHLRVASTAGRIKDASASTIKHPILVRSHKKKEKEDPVVYIILQTAVGLVRVKPSRIIEVAGLTLAIHHQVDPARPEFLKRDLWKISEVSSGCGCGAPVVGTIQEVIDVATARVSALPSRERLDQQIAEAKVRMQKALFELGGELPPISRVKHHQHKSRKKESTR